MGRGGGSVFLLALMLFLALQHPASADKKSYLIIFRDFPVSPSALLSRFTGVSILYELPPIHGIAVNIDESFLTSLQRKSVDAIRCFGITLIHISLMKPELTGVLAVIQDKQVKLHTTHSWDFLGLRRNGKATNAWSSANFGEDTIIGNIDTGNMSHQ
ncbi:hypothetical protein EJB05_17302, partial [Eragrostis curvula]